MEFKHAYLKSFRVNGVYGLHADVEFDRGWINLYGMGGGGRTRFLRCLEAARIIACSGWQDLPGIIDGKAKPGDDMTLTVCVDDYVVKLSLDFSEAESIWGGTFMMVTRCWAFYDRAGDSVTQPIVYGGDADEEEMMEIDDLQERLMYTVREFLENKLVLDIDDAMCHLARLPHKVLGIFGVHGKEDISDNIGRLMPWLCLFSKEEDITVVMDDVFDSIHPLVIDNIINNYFGGYKDVRNKQVVMSCRKAEAMYSNGPCYFFYDGRAVKIDVTDTYSNGHITHLRYRFTKDDEEHAHYWSVWLEYFEKGEDTRVLDDVKAYLRSLKEGENDECK